MADPFLHADGVSAPATRVAAIVPSDAAPIGDAPKAIYVGQGGDIVLQGMGGGADVRLRQVPTGTILPVRARFVRATGTSATDLVALF
ncbi:hypothetical protein GGR88_000292 [Sphingomonas jejuensis]|uniref:Uncharacterized protein n=1 Tax=Sphingomonas jejuensis TaxID=904715 RepID=A0ABX0XHK7_9SPHN|nr:hypothetical protein [Sphingomonas jejuensis]NJC32818.1 hypothetical protein [Sphingomonas jejuensis]